MEVFFRVTGPFCGNSPVSSEFHSQRVCNADFDISLMWIPISCYTNNRMSGDLRLHDIHVTSSLCDAAGWLADQYWLFYVYWTENMTLLTSGVDWSLSFTDITFWSSHNRRTRLDQEWGSLRLHSLIEFFESHSYLTGVTAAELRWHMPNINMTFNSCHVFW